MTLLIIYTIWYFVNTGAFLYFEATRAAFSNNGPDRVRLKGHDYFFAGWCFITMFAVMTIARYLLDRGKK